MQLYVSWLYTGKVQDIKGVDYDAWDEDYNVKALQAWKIAEVMEDVDFKLAIIADIIARTAELDNSGFWKESASFVFVQNNLPEMRAFVAEAFLFNIDQDWLNDGLEGLPQDCIVAVGLAAIRVLGKKKPTRKELLEKYTKGMYEMENEEGDEEESGEEGSDGKDDEDV
jgi:hypothetical protein